MHFKIALNIQLWKGREVGRGGSAIAYSFHRAFIYKHILKCHTLSLGCQINVRGPNKFQRLKSGKKGNGLSQLQKKTTTELDSRKLPPLRVTLSGLGVYLSDTDSAAIFVSKREKQKRFVSFSFRVFLAAKTFWKLVGTLLSSPPPFHISFP